MKTTNPYQAAPVMETSSSTSEVGDNNVSGEAARLTGTSTATARCVADVAFREVQANPGTNTSTTAGAYATDEVTVKQSKPKCDEDGDDDQTGVYDSSVQPRAQQHASNLPTYHSIVDNILESIMDLPTSQNHGHDTDEALPGAYAETSGEDPVRLNRIPPSLRLATQDEPIQPVATELPPQTQESHHQNVVPVSAVESHPHPGLGLLEAVPVDDVTVHDLEAQPFDLDAAKRKKAEVTWNERMVLFLLIGFLGALLATAFGLVLGTKVRQDQKATTTSPPVVPTTVTPSFAPTGPLDLLLQDLPTYTLENLDIISTPQWSAREWLMAHPELLTMPEGRKKQLFALATFFYAMNGPNWPKAIRDDWLLYTKSECFWFSNQYGWFQEGGYEGNTSSVPDVVVQAENYTVILQEIEFDSPDPCNGTGQFQAIYLGQLELGNHKAYIPSEIALLTYLTSILLPGNNISTPIDGLLPQSIYQMSNLTSLNLQSNNLNGVLPSEFGLFTTINQLVLNFNSLSGSIPRQLGMMTSMYNLQLVENFLTGTIPSELGLMNQMKDMRLFYNYLTGPIPTELGLMSSTTTLKLAENMLTGPLPSELALMTQMTDLTMRGNFLTGSIPTEIGMWANMDIMFLFENLFTGFIPSEFGMIKNISRLYLQKNSFTGPIPSELGLLTSLAHLDLSNCELTGLIPSELGQLSAYLFLGGNNFTGPLPLELCPRACLAMNSPFLLGDDFLGEATAISYSECNCPFPQAFPPPNATNEIVINFQYDIWPDENEWLLEAFVSVNRSEHTWAEIASDKGIKAFKHQLLSYSTHLAPDMLYHFSVTDSFGDGIGHGGGISITNGTALTSNVNTGTIMWDVSTVEFIEYVEVYLWVDSQGHVSVVTRAEGLNHTKHFRV